MGCTFIRVRGDVFYFPFTKIIMIMIMMIHVSHYNDSNTEGELLFCFFNLTSTFFFFRK